MMTEPDWRAWETLIRERGFTIDRPRGSAHPRYPDMIYPLDYGHIPGTVGGDGEPVDLFIGRHNDEAAEPKLTGLLRTRDRVKGDEEIKLLWNLTPEETVHVAGFLRSHGLEVVVVTRAQ